MIKGRPPVLLIAGPTASGKSALALAAAERWGGAVVNADSAQVYADLDLLSARPSASDLRRAEHRLYGSWDAASPCSAADWAAAARQEIVGLHSRGRIPVLCGGTGLYLRTLLDGIAPIPPIDPAIRAEVRARTVEENRAELTKLDPARAAALNAADTTRIARALEVVRSTGRTLADWQSKRSGGIGGEIDLKPLILLPPRDWLYRRCDERFEAILDLGAAQEVERLLARHLDPDLPAMRAIGVREIAEWLAGRSTREEAIAAGQLATRRYAKRQYTWFSNQPPADWPRFATALDQPGALDSALALLDPAA